MKPIKTWKDLQHGDVIDFKDNHDQWEVTGKKIIIDILPNSIHIQPLGRGFSSYWITKEEFLASNWQIVQQEEEAKEFYSQSLVDYKEAFLRLDAAILNLKLEREEIRTKYPHLFN